MKSRLLLRQRVETAADCGIQVGEGGFLKAYRHESDYEAHCPAIAKVEAESTAFGEASFIALLLGLHGGAC